jgi:hypothetical protein
MRIVNAPERATRPCTPIIFRGTSCETSVGSCVIDTLTYGTYWGSGAWLGYYYVTTGIPTFLQIVLWILVLVGVWTVAKRYKEWRKRRGAMRAGITRFEAELNLRSDADTTAPTNPIVILNTTTFGSTQAYTNNPAEGITCPICLDNLVPGDNVNELVCAHIYHKECLATWSQTKTTCPMCRHSLESVL